MPAPAGLYEEFAARFPYPETEDQERAIADTLGDLNSGRPMDRLVCGDVGFGKTEIALRAAFIAVMSAARSATSVLPKPTSPHTSRSIGLPAARSPSVESIAAA